MEGLDSVRSIGHFSVIIDSVPTAVIMVREDGTIVLINAQAERLFRYTRHELVGEKIDLLVPRRFRQAHPRLRQAFHREPRARPMGEGRDLYALRKDGSEFPVEIGLNPVQTDEGLFVLGAIVDMSERKRHLDAVERANEALERSNIELQRFAYFVSHDLQTPLRTIASFVQLLHSTYAGRMDAQADDWIGRILHSLTYLQTLTRDLLNYSRVDSQALPFEPVSLEEVLEDALSLLAASIDESSAKVTASPLPVVLGDRPQLVQLMMNLLGNALKYRGPEPPRINLSAQTSGDAWEIAVQDNGIGIAPRHHERIFEIFGRLHDSKEYPGTGIGLAICRRVVHRHGGRIWVRSESGPGSTFLFTLPAPPAF